MGQPTRPGLDNKYDMNAARLGVLLGADSLLGRRSGVVRMTLEIARALHHRPEIGGFSLMTGSRARDPGWVDTLADEPEPPAQAGD